MASLADALAYQQKRQQMLNALNDQPTDLEKSSSGSVWYAA